MYMPRQRQAHILRLLEQRGHLRSAELARELGVTEETIRTDFVALEKRKLLQRLHGGARYLIPSKLTDENDIRLASQLAKAALPLIKTGERIFLEDSIYTRALIAQMSDCPCVIISNSPSLIKLLSPAAHHHQVIALGGRLDKKTGHIFSEESVAQLEQLKADKAFLSPESIAINYIAYRAESKAQLAQALRQHCRNCQLIAPAQSFSGEAPYRCEPFVSDGITTEDFLPLDWPEMPLRLIPYIEPSAWES